MFPIAITYWIWIPAVIILYATIAFFSKIYNDTKSNRAKITVMLLGCLPLWSCIAPYSSPSQLPFDMLLYDSLMTLTMTIILVALTKGSKLGLINFLGIGLALGGFILMKI